MTAIRSLPFRFVASLVLALAWDSPQAAGGALFPGRQSPVGPGPWPVAIADVDGDGLFAAHVTYRTGIDPWSVAIADLDGDGDADVAVASGLSDNVSILLNRGYGTFAADLTYGAGNFPSSVAMADLDGDGDADLAVGNDRGGISILLNNGDGTFADDVTYGAGRHPSWVAIADLDGDGDADLSVPDSGADNGGIYKSEISILLNNGDGTFAHRVTYGVGSRPLPVAIADLDGDGDADLAVGRRDGNVSILLNNGDGTFAGYVAYGVGELSWSVAIADLDGDGDADLAAGAGGNISILLNYGDGTFADAVTYAAGGANDSVAIADLDGDGDADLAMANPTDDNVSILLNHGDATFASYVTYGVGDFPVSVAIADLNGDGYADLAVSNVGSDNVSILLNLSGCCNDNGLPGECEPDCNTNGLNDPCDIAAGTSQDCQANGEPDECEIASGVSADDDGNGVPDECERVCVDVSASPGGSGASWADARNDLPGVPGAAVASGIPAVWLAAGRYTPDGGTGDRGASFGIPEGVTVYGGFAGDELTLDQRNIARNLTILGGDLNGDDGPGLTNYEENSYHVVTVVAGLRGLPAVIDGCSIVGGNADGSYPNNIGGGIYVNGRDMLLRNCTIRDNFASAIGGGALQFGGGGITLVGSVVRGNEAGLFGGGVLTDNGASAFTNCTFVGNDGGGLYTAASGPTVTNCVFWGNTDGLAQDERAQIGWATLAPTVNYTCVQGLTGVLGGTGNIGDDPRFKRDGVHLRMRSPARNAGDPGFAPGEGQTDIDGQPRILNGRVDMGADEVALEFEAPQVGDPGGPPLRKIPRVAR